jgi:hypothetical protein
MTPDSVLIGVTSAVAIVVVLYLVWSDRHHNEESERKRDQQDLVIEIRRELDRNENASLRRCLELQRKLDEHRRILNYLSRRLS